MEPWGHVSMTIPRRSTLRVRISTFLSSAPASRESEQPAIWCESGREPRSPSSKRVTRSAAPGIFFAIRAFARTRICRLSATRSVHGTIRRRSLTAPRSCAISLKRRKPTASIAIFVSASRSCGRRGGPRTLAGRSKLTVQTARSSNSPATFSSCARAITNMRKATRRPGQAWSDSPAALCIRRNGPTTCATTASGSSSSAAARRR